MEQKAKQSLLLMCIIFPLTLSAQFTLNGHYNLPRSRDRLIKQQVAHKAAGDSETATIKFETAISGATSQPGMHPASIISFL